MDNGTTSYSLEVAAAHIYSLPASFPSPAFNFKSKKNADFPTFPLPAAQPEPGSGITQPRSWLLGASAQAGRDCDAVVNLVDEERKGR